MRVALKYCGGCDPAYERTEYFRLIARAAGERLEWVRLDAGDYAAILLICGCDTACPEEEMPAGAPLVCLRNDRLPPEAVVEAILQRGNPDGYQD